VDEEGDSAKRGERRLLEKNIVMKHVVRKPAHERNKEKEL
jgi:hypothetical protein